MDKEAILESLTTLTVNKLRTGLAILGIVIGIGSVIALVSLGQATQQSVQNSIQSLGSNLLTVIPGSTRSGAVQGAAGGGTTLTDDDAKAIQSSSTVTTIQAVSPEVQGRTQVTAGDTNANVTVIGATPAYSTVHNVSIQSGTFISDQDNESSAKVV